MAFSCSFKVTFSHLKFLSLWFLVGLGSPDPSSYWPAWLKELLALHKGSVKYYFGPGSTSISSNLSPEYCITCRMSLHFFSYSWIFESLLFESLDSESSTSLLCTSIFMLTSMLPPLLDSSLNPDAPPSLSSYVSIPWPHSLFLLSFPLCFFLLIISVAFSHSLWQICWSASVSTLFSVSIFYSSSPPFLI